MLFSKKEISKVFDKCSLSQDDLQNLSGFMGYIPHQVSESTVVFEVHSFCPEIDRVYVYLFVQSPEKITIINKASFTLDVLNHIPEHVQNLIDTIM